MSEAIITVENLGKKYRIAHQGERQRYVALRDVIAEKARGIFKMLKTEKLKSGNNAPISGFRRASVSHTEDFWALKGVSFEVKRGEVVGIIGRNGAGKSTLLKILSRITEPTEGRVRMGGRVGSLLEVGTGFHPELTGRENIFLNGAILGMHRAEIRRKFDEIVAFAEMEKFLDTPVKRYSSGMYVRLAFAVAAHLEPEILIVDEVLAVGDAEFQKKCLGKMENVSRKEGRTVIFVSHNLAAVRSLCSRGIFLREGQVVANDEVSKALRAYAESLPRSGRDSEMVFKFEGQKPRFSQLSLEKVIFECGEIIRIHGEIFSELSCQASIEVELHDDRDIPVAYGSTSPMAGPAWNLKRGTTRFEIKLGPLWLAEGTYRLFFWLIKPWTENYHLVEEPLYFELTHSDPYSSGFSFKQSYKRGSFAIPIQATLEPS
jgi:lipopolysaccharide transport system ATP-binding protein